jgi:RHH-type rel operon transcriptional repressor/antitoxin RelB
MKSLAVRIEDDMEKRLENLANVTGRSKSFYVKKAIEEFLNNKEDYLLGLAVLENQEEEYSLEEVRAMLKKSK